MPGIFRTVSFGAALLAGTAAAHAQYIVDTGPDYVAPAAVAVAPAPTYIAPGPAYIAPAPAYVAPAPAYVAPVPPALVPQRPVAEEIITRPAARTIVATERQSFVEPQASVRETMIEHSAPTRTIHRSARTTRVHLTSRQRRDVLRTIRYERTAPAIARERVITTAATTTAPAVSYGIGSVLPAAVPTYAMPQQVVYEAPALRGYAYAPFDDRVLVVEPASHMVVDELY